jgi:hypothetical protein
MTGFTVKRDTSEPQVIAALLRGYFHIVTRNGHFLHYSIKDIKFGIFILHSFIQSFFLTIVKVLSSWYEHSSMSH